MARFTYHGPVQSIELAVARPRDKDGKEITKDKDGNDIPRFKVFDFVQGREISDLPADSLVIKVLIARDLLRSVDEENATDTDTAGASPAKTAGKPAKADAASAPEPKGEK